MTVDGQVLRVDRLRKTFDSDAMPVRALRRVDLTVESGEFVAVMGPSGCGKSTLLHLVAGLDTASDGEILLAGIPLTGKDESERAHAEKGGREPDRAAGIPGARSSARASPGRGPGWTPDGKIP